VANSVSHMWKKFIGKKEIYSISNVEKTFFSRILSSRWISTLLRSGGHMGFLEAGCGLGRFGISIATTGKNVTLMDCSEKSLSDARQLQKCAEDYYHALNISYDQGDVERMRYEDDRFDVTFNEGVIEHWLDQRERINVIKEMVRVTKDGGLVSIRVVNNKNSLYNYLYLKSLKTHLPEHHRYDLKGLIRDMRDAGLEIHEYDGELVNDPGNWVRNVWLTKSLTYAGIIINRMPRMLRRHLCSSIFCTGIVRKPVIVQLCKQFDETRHCEADEVGRSNL